MKSFAPLLTTKNKIWFLGLDLLLFLAAAALMISLSGSELPSGIQIFELALISLAAPVIQYIFGNYDLDHISGSKQLLVRQGLALLMTLLTSMVVVFILNAQPIGPFERSTLLGAFGLFSVSSFIYRRLVISHFKAAKGKLKWLIIADPACHEIVKKDFSDLQFEGTLEFFNPAQGKQALTTILKKGWSTLVISISDKAQQKELGPLVIEAKCSGVQTITIVEFYERHLRKVPVHMLDYSWFINAGGFDSISHPIQLRLKRLMDIAISGVLLLLTSPAMLIVSILIKAESKGPALYKQTRTGKDGESFTIYKFRSMRTDAEKNGAQWASQNDNRVTKVGRFIRLTRLDELPQLWNVLKGEMSFVGPRPERPEFNDMLKQQLPYYDLRHTLRPGLTGWAQVLYPYGASVEDSKEKLQFELYYIKHSNIFLDLMIILKTIAVVVGARGR